MPDPPIRSWHQRCSRLRLPLIPAVLCCALLRVFFVGEPGKGCQKTQKAITDVCYHDSFAADAVLMRKPIRATSTSGRTFEFSSAPGKSKRGRETGFVKKRNHLVEHSFIPRCVCVCMRGYEKKEEA